VKYGGFRFTESSHLKDVLAYLSLALTLRETHSLIRVLKLCEGIGAAGAEKIQTAVAGKQATRVRVRQVGAREPRNLVESSYPASNDYPQSFCEFSGRHPVRNLEASWRIQQRSFWK
jgi:superfamily I DNA/RNA helicase